MIDHEASVGPEAMVDALVSATNAHDLDALVACFAVDYTNETPAHPGRGFQGRDQVRRNWEQIFAGVPDVNAVVLQMVVDGNTVWSEWEMRGTRLDGVPHVMRGVILFGVAGNHATSARFYLEPVDPDDGGGVDAAVRRAAGPS
jgi:ketosteroid isomerase-like protein